MKKKLSLKKKTVLTLTNTHLKNVKGGKDTMGLDTMGFDTIATSNVTIANCG